MSLPVPAYCEIIEKKCVIMSKFVQYRYWWFAFSGIIILPGLYFLLLHPLITTGQPQLGLTSSIDFSGGALWEIRFQEQTVDTVSTADIAAAFEAQGFENARVQISSTTLEDEERDIATTLVRTRSLDPVDPAAEQERLLNALQEQFGEVTRERLETVGPTVSQESTRSAIIAVVGASIVILIYLTWAFREAPHPVRYGVCAILAMLHDVILILGIASILGVFFNVEVDALFLTALLTILSFSVHDTIVVFDRIRENLIAYRTTKVYGEVGQTTFEEVVNHSIVQTLPRSINTQLTTMFTLTALLLFGGESIRNFVLIMLIGLISGTYSSIFNAAQLLVIWENREWERWFKRSSDHDQKSAVAGSR